MSIVPAVKKTVPKTKLLFWIFAVGLVLRALMIGTEPILENDYFRYLWDGAVTTQGINPYTYSPEQVLGGQDVPQTLKQLADGSGDVIGSINNPTIRTIYPPLGQAVFALSHWIGPWDLYTWKLILLVFDIATLILLGLGLRTLGLSHMHLAIYWWNPLLVKEIFNSGHMDVIVFPFVIGGLLLVVMRRYLWAVFTLTLGVGVKIFPVFLLPVALKPLLGNPKRLLAPLAIIGVLLAIMLIPIMTAGLGDTSGFIAYGKTWQNNDSIFRGFIWFAEHTLPLMGFKAYHKYLAARIVISLLLLGFILYVILNKQCDREKVFSASLFILAFAYLISPTQFPWYYTWLIPLLTITPYYSLLFLSVTLPLYYLSYYFDALDRLETFNNIVVWIEFVPIWILIAIEWAANKSKCEKLNAA